MSGTLYVVATPIGNLADMTPRAMEVLAQADLIAAEDTRVSKVLLSHFKIKTPSFSCHKFNEGKRGDFFVSALLEGKSVAIISDAGTPCISDPGHRLVRLAADRGIEVVAVCGANAAAAALSVSGFDASRFIFVGFLPRTESAGAKALEVLLTLSPVVFYESPMRIKKTLKNITVNYPFAQLCLCNDLTKKFERVYRGTAPEVLTALSDNPHAEKGEYTCVAYLDGETEPPTLCESAEPSLESQLVDIMVSYGVSLKEASQILHGAGRKLPKKDIYAAALRLKELLKANYK